MLGLDLRDRLAVDEASVDDEGLHHPGAHCRVKTIHQGHELPDLRALVALREHLRPAIQEEVLRTIAMRQRHHLVVAPKLAALSLSLGEILLRFARDRVIVLIEQSDARALVALVVGHEEVRTVDEEDPLGVVDLEVLEVARRG